MKLDKNLVIGIALGAGLVFLVPMILNKKTSANLARHPHHRHSHRGHPYGYYGDSHAYGFPL